MTFGNGRNTMTDPESTFRALKPAALDELTEDAYARRREDDLDRAMRGASATQGRKARWRPTILVAGLATACAATAGTVVATTAAGRHGTSPARTPAATPTRQLDARGVLLASAATAERMQVKPGRYWYDRERTQTVQSTRTDVKGAKPGELARRPQREVTKLPYTYLSSGGQESWMSRTGRDRSRTITSIDVRTTFPTPADRAEWVKAGSPDLVEKDERKPSVNNYDIPLHFQIGNEQVQTDDLLKLPTDADDLSRYLRKRRALDVQRAGGPQNVDPYPYYVWTTAQDLLAGPITPGTKAALYRVLAQQPGVRSDGMVTDQLGRRGLSVTLPLASAFGSKGPDGEVRLVIDPKSAQLLAYESYDSRATGTPGLSVAYESMGWVDSLDGRVP
ncbi:CU044_5270 family protein [Actinomadura barringtoniae]|uniref:CU044_5270 family protein n=1 Tax=Actinomadura barringtoniae TaxID=1427535 RepID=A0A939T7T6_9ACTN|nr:CU044_5270 family protein [Actinomadura barringtoniae]MBO2452364.1 CU044_5270 family protein [Actinomadura barringtoniae]